MKVWKKNLVAAAVLVTVCAGIYVNWRYTEDQATANLTDTLDAEKVMSDDTLELSGDMAAISAGEDVSTTSSDYFAAVRLSRQQARDNAVSLLQEAAEQEGADQEAATEASRGIQVLAGYTMKEAQIESLVTAKGYADCVAFMGEDGVSVVVSTGSGELTGEDVARITDIAMKETGYDASGIRIMAAN